MSLCLGQIRIVSNCVDCKHLSTENCVDMYCIVSKMMETDSDIRYWLKVPMSGIGKNIIIDLDLVQAWEEKTQQVSSKL